MVDKKIIGILSVPHDLHALMVSTVLREMGHTPIRILLQNYPQVTSCTFRIGTNHFDHLVNKEASKIDTLWVRRPRKSVVSKELHEADREFFEKEAAMVDMANIGIYTDQAFTVNPVAAINVAENKILQLRYAVASGFVIPETLISNDADEVRSFVRKMDVSGCIYKSMLPHSFSSWGEHRSSRTASVSLDQLPSDSMLKNGGGIYQEKVPKQYEIRVTVFGRFLAAAKLDSQCHHQGKHDWRSIPEGELKVEPYDLPLDIQEKCFSLLSRLGLVMGCFDFIVTPDNEYIFLEVNQQGQFLFIEQLCPDILLLEPFCRFLVSGSKNFSHIPEKLRYNPSAFIHVLSGIRFKHECDMDGMVSHASMSHQKTTMRETPNEN